MQATNTRKPVLQPKVNRFTVFFFKGSLWHIRLLQLLIGGKLSDPSHVIYSLNDTSYEITTSGLVVGKRNTAALYRECMDAYTFVLSDAEAFVLTSYFDTISTTVFSWKDCVSYCWRLLVGCKGCERSYYNGFTYYGSVERFDPQQALYFPPFSCTAPLWEALGEMPANWDSFAPSAIYKELTA